MTTTDVTQTAREIAAHWTRTINPRDETRVEAIRYISQQLMHGFTEDRLRLSIDNYYEEVKDKVPEPRFRTRLKKFFSGGLEYEPFRSYLEDYQPLEPLEPKEKEKEAPKEALVPREKYVQFDMLVKQFGSVKALWEDKKRKGRNQADIGESHHDL